MSDQRAVEVGRVARAHGLRGEIRVRVHNPESTILDTVEVVWLECPGEPRKRRSIVSRRYIGRHVALKLEGVSDRDHAESLVGARILVSRDELPELEEDEYYHVDLLGSSVHDAEGKSIGRIASIYAAGAHDVFVVERDGGGELLVPVVTRFVRDIDLAARRVTLAPLSEIEALMSDGDEV